MFPSIYRQRVAEYLRPAKLEKSEVVLELKATPSTPDLEMVDISGQKNV
jgi:hypothetical protein